MACLLPNKQRFAVGAVTDASDVFVLNAAPPSMAKLSRGLSASDGFMDVVVLRCANVFNYLTATFCMAIGRPDLSKHYSRVRVKELAIKAALPVLPNIDGDPWVPTTEVRMRLIPSAVNIVLSH